MRHSLKPCHKFCRLLTQYFDIFQLKGTLREYIETLFKAMPQVCRLLTQYFDIFQLKGTLREYIETLFKAMPQVCHLLRYDYGSPGE